MKKLYFLFFLTIGFFANAQIVNIPDANFMYWLLSASPSNTTASTETPVFNPTTGTWSVSSYSVVDANGDGEIQVSEAQAIKFLNVYNGSIYDLQGISSFTNLEFLNINSNPITSLNVSALSNLKGLTCAYTQLTSLNVLALSNLKSLNCTANSFTNLNVSGLTNLQYLAFTNCTLLTSLNVSGCVSLQNLWCPSNQLTGLDVSGLTNLQMLDCSQNQIASLNVSGCSSLQKIQCQYNQISSLDVSSLTNLNILECYTNQMINLNTSSCFNLQTLACQDNQITSLDVSSLNNLQYLECYTNQIQSIDLSGFTNLIRLSCSNNQLTNLNVSGVSNLGYLNCINNQLPSLNISDLNNLQVLYCSSNLISDINFTNNPLLQILFCGANNITSLDVSNLNNLTTLNCSNSSNLTYINMKNGSIENSSSLNFSLCPNLEFICCDDAQLTQVQNLITTYNYTNCGVSSLDCTYPFLNELSGIVSYDYTNNGCNQYDDFIPNVKFNVFDGTDTFTTFGKQNGRYFMPLVNGNYTITPVLEQPNYFNVSPNNVTIDFPALSSPHVQDFCVTWNQIDYFDDLEVLILPMTPARPGFEAVYKVMVRNKGFDTTYGTVSLTYDNSILTYVSSNPLYTTTTTNSLSWDILQIIPFEVLEYEVRFNLNSPTASPPVNNGDELHFTAQVAHEDYIEYTPDDNTFTLDQTVVGSYDPNDKVCLQGETEEVSIVGEYVHYMIRFENTGTFLAEKVVVEDFIDVSKFDITTLIPLNASHAYFTKIAGNKVEFIFDNINLDFNNPNNDGFIAFKIKLLPTLVVGDTFTNSANIYFDFNPAIVTDIYTTTIVETLSNATFENNSFTLYPNPTKDILNIEFRNQTEIKSITIYNLIGQLVISVPNVTNSIDVSNLASGTYFVKIISEKGSANAKFVKE